MSSIHIYTAIALPHSYALLKTQNTLILWAATIRFRMNSFTLSAFHIPISIWKMRFNYRFIQTILVGFRKYVSVWHWSIPKFTWNLISCTNKCSSMSFAGRQPSNSIACAIIKLWLVFSQLLILLYVWQTKQYCTCIYISSRVKMIFDCSPINAFRLCDTNNNKMQLTSHKTIEQQDYTTNSLRNALKLNSLLTFFRTLQWQIQKTTINAWQNIALKLFHWIYYFHCLFNRNRDGIRNAVQEPNNLSGRVFDDFKEYLT